MSKYKFDGSQEFNIKEFDCADTGEFEERHESIREFINNLEQINEYQQKIFAEKKEGIIFVFQAMDAAGKDGAVRAVLSCLSPQGVSEYSFKKPSNEDNAHDYLWRFWKALPEKGNISIFNRSYYEDVLVQKVHKYYEKNKYADRINKNKIIDQRYRQINNFEQYLWENSFRVIKIFLNVSKDEQARRFISRVDTPKKNWKFSSSDIEEREYWDDYMNAFEVCINKTSKKFTPWYVVPADHKWYARLLISRIILEELKNMNPDWPVLPAEEMEKLGEYKTKLVLETGVEKLTSKDKSKEKGFKVKPADTAISNALNADTKALKKKKINKHIKEVTYQTFKTKYGVSEEYLELLATLYLSYEEIETAAEIENVQMILGLFKEKRSLLKGLLGGKGKEAKKLYKRFQKEAEKYGNYYNEGIKELYSLCEDAVNTVVEEYEKNIAEFGVSLEDAFKVYENSMKTVYGEHRTRAYSLVEETCEELNSLYEKYYEAIEAYYKAGQEEAEADFEEADGTEAADEEIAEDNIQIAAPAQLQDAEPVAAQPVAEAKPEETPAAE